MTISREPQAPRRALPGGEAVESPEREFAPLLDEPFAAAWAARPPTTGDPTRTQTLRGRLLERVAVSRDTAQPMTIARHTRVAPQVCASGVTSRTLYACNPARAVPRPGEPERACLVELAPGAAMTWPAGTDLHREWLVLSGSLRLGEERLAVRDYHVDPVGFAGAAPLATDEGACLFLRESRREPQAGDGPFTMRDAESGWPEFVPGIRRRVLWQRGREAALLYSADAGAFVPHHSHGHDEECLMLEGELFLDDVLLRAGDYELAPAGTAHGVTRTETAVVVYAHGDLDLQFIQR